MDRLQRTEQKLLLGGGGGIDRVTENLEVMPDAVSQHYSHEQENWT